MRKQSFLLSLLVCTALLIGCYSEKGLFADQNPVPPDFGKDTTSIVLVFKTDQEKVNKTLDKAFRKYYSGKYELVEPNDIYYGAKYDNKNKYRFCFRTEKRYNPGMSGMTRMPPSWDYTFKVVDRKGDTYGLTYYGGGYKGLMEAYVRKLESTKAAQTKTGPPVEDESASSFHIDSTKITRNPLFKN